jgi:hypothetical protein
MRREHAEFDVGETMSLPNLPFYRQLPQMKPLIWSGGNTIQPGKGYVYLRFRAKRLGRDVVGTSVRVPPLHAIVDSGLGELQRASSRMSYNDQNDRRRKGNP